MSPLKILVFTIPASGHVNPLVPVLNELNKNGNFKIIVYLSEEFRSSFESIGVDFRPLANFNLADKVKLQPVGDKKKILSLKIIRAFLQITEANVEYLANEIDKEKPDFIFYDLISMHLKWALKYYKKWYDIALKKSPEQRTRLKFCPQHKLPPMISFSTSFTMNDEIYPNKFEMSLAFSFSFGLIGDFLKLMFTMVRICFRFGLTFPSLKNDLKMDRLDKTKFIIVGVSPDLHPRSHLYDKRIYKFVGSTVNETKIDKRAEEEPFKSLFSAFPTIDREIALSDFESQKNSKLIFASLGTAFNNNLSIYRKIIDSFKAFDQEPTDSRHPFLKLENFKVIVSTGEIVYKEIQDLLSSKKYEIPENILVVKSAPQLEILKRASLFLTHCGMNSTSESIHFGVPMICIPIAEDQPLVAYRVSDELGLGLSLDYSKMKASDIRNAAHKILNEKSYYERLQRYSLLSRKYTGYKEASDLILNALTKSD